MEDSIPGANVNPWRMSVGLLFLSISKGSASDNVSDYVVTGLGGVSILNLYNLLGDNKLSTLLPKSEKHTPYRNKPDTKSALQGQSIKILKDKPVFTFENSLRTKE